MGAPLIRPNQLKPAPRPNYQQFKSVNTKSVEEIAFKFSRGDGDSRNLSAKEAMSAAKAIRQRASLLSDSKKIAVYESYATVFENLALALNSRDPNIDTFGGSLSDTQGGDGQLYIGSRFNRTASELRNLASRVGTTSVLSFKDFNA